MGSEVARKSCCLAESAKGTIRVGVVGTGFGGAVHVPAFRADGRCEVGAICADTQGRAAKTAESLKVSAAYGDWREMIERADVDAISIATPPMLQSEIALAAIAHGKAVFCEKPLAISEAVAREMTVAAERAGAANMVDFEFPEIDQWQQARSILHGGIGPLRHAHVSWNVETYANRKKLNDSWKTDARMGGGVLNNFVSHTLGYMEWFLGGIERLCAKLTRPGQDARAGDTMAVLCLEFASGAAASVSVSSDAFLGGGHRLEFYGEDGTVVLENRTKDYTNGFELWHGTRASDALEEVATPRESQAVQQDGRIDAVARLVKRFLDWMETGVPAEPSFRQGLRVQQLLGAARQADRMGRWVEVVERNR